MLGKPIKSLKLIQFLIIPVLDKTTGKTYIMMAARLSALFKAEEEYTVLERYSGSGFLIL